MYLRPRIALRFWLWAALLFGAVDARPSDGLDRLPAATDGLVTIANVERLHEILGIASLRGQNPGEFLDLSRDMMEAIGVDALDLAALREAGIRTDEALHIAWLAEPASTLVLLIPGDESTMAWLTGVEAGDDRFARRATRAGVDIATTPDDDCACFATGTHVVFVGPTDDDEEGTGGALERARALVEHNGAPLSESPPFVETMRKVPGDADVTAYFGPELYRKAGWQDPEELAKHGMTPEEAMRLYESLGFGDNAVVYKATLHPDRIDGEGFTTFGPGAAFLDWCSVDTDPIPFLGRLDAVPWLTSIGRLDGAAFWRSLQDLFEVVLHDSVGSMGDALADFHDNTGLDFERDVVDQVNGNLGFVVERAGMMGVDAVAFVQVVDEERLRHALAHLTETMRERNKRRLSESDSTRAQRAPAEITEDRAGDTVFYRVASPPMGELCYGAVDDHLVVTFSPARFRSIVAAERGLFDTVENDIVSSALRDRSGAVVHLDFAGVTRDLMSVLPVLGPRAESVIRLLRGLRDCSVVTTAEEGGTRHRFQLRAWEAGMWSRLAAALLGLDSDGGSEQGSLD